MALSIPENNQLYLYQLLKRELGAGKQTFITRVEEVLAADDLSPLDLGASDARELLEALGGFIELKVFKGGRVYAIVRPREDWDAALARADKGGAKSAKGKPWKRSKNALKPVKPKRSKARLEAERRAAEQAQAASGHAADAKPERAAEAPNVPAAPEPETSAPDAERAAPSPAANQNETARQADGSAAVQAAAAPHAAAEKDADAAAPEHADAAPSPDEGAAAKEVPDAPAPAAGGISLTITYDPGDGQEPGEADADDAACVAASAPADSAVTTSAAAHPAEPQAGFSPNAPREAPGEAAPAAPSSGAPAAQEPALFIPHAQGGRAAAPAAAGAGRADYPRTISEDVYCRNAPLSMLTRILPYGIDLMAVLDEDWRVARATGTAAGTRNRVSFPLRYLEEDGSAPVEVTLKRSQRPGTGARWELALVDGDDGTGSGHEAADLEGLPQADEGAWADLDPAAASRMAAPFSPVRAFAQDVMIGSWDNLLGTLARTALPERWSTRAKPAPGERYDILREYVAVSWCRAKRQGAVAASADGAFAAFNTGLFDAAYEDICLCLEATGQDIPWRLVGLATAGNGDLGRRIIAELGQAPQAPSYLSELADIVPDPAALAVPDYRTLLGPCLGRLPRGFLTEMLSGEPGADELLDRLFAAGTLPADRRAALSGLSRLIDGAPALRRRLCRALDDAVDTARRRCQRSYRTAAPVYDPRADRMKLLLPLALVDDRTADCALVLDRQPSGTYQAASALALPRAYACARVVCADMPAWLNPAQVLG